LVDITGANDFFEEHYREYGERQVMKFLLGDERHAGSVLRAMSSARENCRTIRDIVPREAWEQINELYHFVRDELQQGMTKRGRHPYLRQVILGIQTISGLLAETMLHDQGFKFLLIGRNIERADMTSRIVDVRSASLLPQDPDDPRPFDTLQWVSVLNSLSAYQMYRRSEQVRVQRGPVLRFLIQSAEFPRALHHCLETVRQCLEGLPQNEACLRVEGRLKRFLLGSEVERLTQSELHTFVDELQLGIADLHAEIARSWFPPPLDAAI
jgi:uncharacterized alpha-E superfamily protein